MTLAVSRAGVKWSRPAGSSPQAIFAIAAALSFAALTCGVLTRTTDGLDLAIARAFGGAPVSVADDASGWLTVLGQAPVDAAAVAALAIIARGSIGARFALVALFGAATAIELLLKLTVVHPGPPIEFTRHSASLLGLDIGTPGSYPSGHVERLAFLSVVALRRWPSLIVTWSAVVLIAAMAVSRVYIGDHWLSDVCGGAALGIAVGFVAVLLLPGEAHPEAQDASTAKDSSA